MRPSRLALAFVIALSGPLSAPLAANAAELGDSVYLSVRAIGSIAKIDDVSTTGFTGTANVENDSDEAAGVALVAGYVFKEFPVRAELEVGHRFRFDLDVRDQLVGTAIDYEINVATTSAIASVILEWRNDSDFTPFVGGSIGWARNWSDSKRIVLSTQARVEEDNNTDNLAWGGTVGLDWDFAEHWMAELAYRYINLGEVETGLLSGTQVTADDYVSHDVLLSVGYRF